MHPIILVGVNEPEDDFHQSLMLLMKTCLQVYEYLMRVPSNLKTDVKNELLDHKNIYLAPAFDEYLISGQSHYCQEPKYSHRMKLVLTHHTKKKNRKKLPKHTFFRSSVISNVLSSSMNNQ